MRDTNETIQLKAVLIVREMLTKQSLTIAKIAFIFTSLSAVQIYDFHIFTANQTKDNPQCARDINQTIKLQTVLSVREIQTKQSN